MKYLNTAQRRLLEQFIEMADKVCDSFTDCNDCPFNGFASCPYVQVHDAETDIDFSADLPIDLDDDNHCDECYKPVFNECLTDKYNDDCPYDLGECCEDNLATNVGRICFEHNVSTNVAMAIIEIIQKERDRNEYLHLYRKHFPAE